MVTAYFYSAFPRRLYSRTGRVQSLHGQLRKPVTVLDGTGVGKAAVELFRKSGFYASIFTLIAGDQVT